MELPHHTLIPTIDNLHTSKLQLSSRLVELDNNANTCCFRYRRQLRASLPFRLRYEALSNRPSAVHGGVHADDATAILPDIVLLGLGCQQ
jgi:hypothetical protein